MEHRGRPSSVGLGCLQTTAHMHTRCSLRLLSAFLKEFVLVRGCASPFLPRAHRLHHRPSHKRLSDTGELEEDKRDTFPRLGATYR